MEYRYATSEDLLIISSLLDSCFGDSSWYAYDDTKFLLAIDNGNAIGLAGIEDIHEYNGRLVSLVGVINEYRGRGIATELISRLIADIEDDIYCVCWQWPHRSVPNLNHAMETLGFSCVLPNVSTYSADHFGICKNCLIRKDHCVCHEHLYYKKGSSHV